jgi:hypothetical protein
LNLWVSLPGNPRQLQSESDAIELRGPDPRGAFLLACDPIDPGAIKVIILKPGPEDWASFCPATFAATPLY